MSINKISLPVDATGRMIREQKENGVGLLGEDFFRGDESISEERVAKFLKQLSNKNRQVRESKNSNVQEDSSSTENERLLDIDSFI
jgi:hypothetical protein